MKIELTMNGSSSAAANYLCWAPTPCQVRISDTTGVSGPVNVTLKNHDSQHGGQVVFGAAAGAALSDTLDLVLPASGAPVDFFSAGKYPAASRDAGDAAIDVTDRGNGTVLSATTLMVRIRKDANQLTASERDRFVNALAKLNDAGMGRFSIFPLMHKEYAALRQAHGEAGFLPWHRAYLLDLERELQKIDASVTLPYWRFDARAEKVFTLDFLGVSDVNGTVHFSGTNKLQFWQSDGAPGITRQPYFDTALNAARGEMGPVASELTTLALGTIYGDFVRMEGQPHGAAHVSFTGLLHDPATAPRDPLFFLLHANVDRLWAMWQFVNKRFDTSVVGTYSRMGKAGNPGAGLKGHNLLDTLWPWDNDTTPPRPNNAPGGPMPGSPTTNAPSPSPLLREMIDFQGKLNPATRLGFDYDDVPFQK